MSKVALLVIDMQKNCKEATSCKSSFEKAVEYINEISEYFRKKTHTVVIIQDLEAGGPETEGFNCVEELVVSDNDFFVHKTHSNAFWETGLDTILKSEGVDCVIIRDLQQIIASSLLTMVLLKGVIILFYFKIVSQALMMMKLNAFSL